MHYKCCDGDYGLFGGRMEETENEMLEQFCSLKSEKRGKLENWKKAFLR